MGTSQSSALKSELGAPASLSNVQQAIDEAAKGTGFQCVPVSWEDAQRGTVGGTLSCWGGNISDVRLWEKGGELLYTCRTQNWNERLGYVAAKDVAVVVGNHVHQTPVKAVSLQSYLQGFRQYASYAGVTSEALYDASVDGVLSIRFQTVFLPVEHGKATEFCTEVYNYNAHSDDDPRNVTMLCSAQGTSVQQDGAGAKRVYHHEVDAQGQVHRYWLEAEQSTHKVGGQQVESREEAKAAADRGKSTAIHIGTRAMGTRFNVQMLIQLPLKQKPVPQRRCTMGWGASNSKSEDDIMESADDIMESMQCMTGTIQLCSAAPHRKSLRGNVGVSNAARVSRGKEFDVWGGLVHKEPVRDPSMHGTITVTMYYTVAGGVPSPADVRAAIEDLDALYKACPSDKRLVDCTELTKELTVKEMQDISAKITMQPYTPHSKPVANNSGGFPQ